MKIGGSFDIIGHLLSLVSQREVVHTVDKCPSDELPACGQTVSMKVPIKSKFVLVLHANEKGSILGLSLFSHHRTGALPGGFFDHGVDVSGRVHQYSG